MERFLHPFERFITHPNDSSPFLIHLAPLPRFYPCYLCFLHRPMFSSVKKRRIRLLLIEVGCTGLLVALLLYLISLVH
ncbi:hypothetical protein C5O19_21950 [Siphonobacter curvatus]|uniref:Uncharacterized protein n=1 Tax=Siphonobacter curvatus TaxID=2094562 RepID=A0A2S7IG84_9BACT|nr:hypothetical protein C5O19_21950 [Siphonobacter curvatus]